jgi:hypothetical protein
MLFSITIQTVENFELIDVYFSFVSEERKMKIIHLGFLEDTY